jgi:hypothetical protein
VIALLLVAVAVVDVTATEIELRLEPGRLDYFLPAPAKRTVVFTLDARNAPPKSRIMFTSPLPAGRHRYRILVVHGRPDRTLTIATPVRPGRSSFEVNVRGPGRFDLGFWSSGPQAREYRFTLDGPVSTGHFALEM